MREIAPGFFLLTLRFLQNFLLGRKYFWRKYLPLTESFQKQDPVVPPSPLPLSDEPEFSFRRTNTCTYIVEHLLSERRQLCGGTFPFHRNFEKIKNYSFTLCKHYQLPLQRVLSASDIGLKSINALNKAFWWFGLSCRFPDLLLNKLGRCHGPGISNIASCNFT